MRDPNAVELGRQAVDAQVELAQPNESGFEPAVAEARGRSPGADPGDQIASFSRTGLTDTTCRLNFSSDSCKPAATPTSCAR